jgi:hypothetical protein
VLWYSPLLGILAQLLGEPACCNCSLLVIHRCPSWQIWVEDLIRSVRCVVGVHTLTTPLAHTTVSHLRRCNHCCPRPGIPMLLPAFSGKPTSKGRPRSCTSHLRRACPYNPYERRILFKRPCGLLSVRYCHTGKIWDLRLLRYPGQKKKISILNIYS